MKNTIIAIAVLVLLGVGVYFLTQKSPDDKNLTDNKVDLNTPVPNNQQNPDTQNPNAEGIVKYEGQTVLGKSVDGNDIMAYHYGTGDTELIFVGGIHGGYSWNTSLVAFEMADYLKANPQVVPANIKVTVVPVMNPDGLEKVTDSTGRFSAEDVNPSQSVQTSGRFNGNTVDLSRNFDCDWKASALWQNKTVSGGTAVFSEPESLAMKNYVEANVPDAVVVWYSAEGKVYSSSCGGAVMPETTKITNLFAKASGYPAASSFNAYKVTGDFVDWLAKKEIPAISVLLTNHKDTEWDKNKAGLEALLIYYTK